ncbi:MAG TPA: hypothetical protein VFR29_07185 [Steroidobacteraceae bacterium]|nr:hypothetical protein [Steroidobacteraceae bacterium]
MFTMVAKSTRMAVSAVAAVAVVSFSGLVLDQGHIASAPRGTVEIGELTPVDATEMALVTLPEVTVLAKRESAADSMLAAQLPEIVVSAKRVAYIVAKAQAARGGQANASRAGSTDGALLK